MKKIKLLMILLISTIFISCSPLESYRKVISVEDKKVENVRVTTYEDGTTKVENLDFIRWQESRERDRKKKERRDRR